MRAAHNKQSFSCLCPAFFVCFFFCFGFAFCSSHDQFHLRKLRIPIHLLLYVGWLAATDKELKESPENFSNKIVFYGFPYFFDNQLDPCLAVFLLFVCRCIANASSLVRGIWRSNLLLYFRFSAFIWYMAIVQCNVFHSALRVSERVERDGRDACKL